MPDVSLIETIEALTLHQQEALKRLLDQQGDACGVSTQYCKALAGKGLLAHAEDPRTHVKGLCTCGGGHFRYVFPEALAEAYQAWEVQAAMPATPAAYLLEPEDVDPSLRVEVMDVYAAMLPAAPVAPWDPYALPATPPIAPQAAVQVLTPTPLSPTHSDVPLYWARIMNPFYDALELFGTWYDRGELLTLPPDVTEDAAIRRLDYVMVAPRDKAYLHAACGVCGKWFVSERFRDAHGQKRHQDRFADDEVPEVGAGMQSPTGDVTALRDTTGDSADRRQWQEFPPNLERSKASLAG